MIYVILYLSAIVLANLTVAHFGPSVSILNAFLFIGLDLTARDSLHEQWKGKHLARNMALLIAAGSLLSWFLNRNAGQIALASFVAFAAAAVVDTVAYRLLDGRARWLKINGSNIPAGAVDSMIFPALAFGFPLLWPIMLGQFAAKVLGGFVWSIILVWARFGTQPHGAKDDDMTEKCEHKTSQVEYYGAATLSVCTWGCGATLIGIKDGNGISHEFTADDILTLAARVAGLEAATAEGGEFTAANQPFHDDILSDYSQQEKADVANEWRAELEGGE